MDGNSNPYETPLEQSEKKVDLPIARGWTHKRRLAVLVVTMPLILAFPLKYWALNFAGSWFVSTEIDSNQRLVFLGIMYVILMLCITVVSMFAASVLLWVDRWHPLLSGTLSIIFGVVVAAALLFVVSGLLR